LKYRHGLLPPNFLGRNAAQSEELHELPRDPRTVIAGWGAMESAMSGVVSVEVCGACFRLGRFASPTQTHSRSIEDECLFTCEHLRISIRHRGRHSATATNSHNVQ
jgi:hypothetical protein